MEARSRLQGSLMVAMAAILWGTLGPTFRGLAAVGMPPLQIAFARVFLAGVIIAVWMAYANPSLLRVQRRDLPLFALYGFVSVSVFFVLYPTAVQLSTVAVAAVLLYTAPAWVALMAAFFLGEPLTMRKGVAILVTFLGTALVAGIYDREALGGNVLGVLAGLASGLTYATYGIFGKAVMRRYSPQTTLFYALGFGALFLLPLILLDLDALVEPLQQRAGIGLLLYITLFPTMTGTGLYTVGLQRLNDAGRASIIATVEPLVAALLGYRLLGEALEPLQWLGGAFILAGVLFLASTRSAHPARPAERARPNPPG